MVSIIDEMIVELKQNKGIRYRCDIYSVIQINWYQIYQIPLCHRGEQMVSDICDTFASHLSQIYAIPFFAEM